MSVEKIEVYATSEVVAAWQSHFAEPQVVERGDGLTCSELAVIAGCSVATMRRRLAAGVKSGAYTRSTGWRVKSDGTRNPMPIYAMVKKSKRK